MSEFKKLGEISSKRIDNILRLAELAESGPWKFDAGNHDVELPDDNRRTIFSSEGSEMYTSCQDDSNLEYIAELDPDTVISILEELKFRRGW